jgi:hypothetical protein
VKLGGKKEYFHRLVGLSLTPNTTDQTGAEVEWSFVSSLGEAKKYEVHHSDENPRNCCVDNLHVLWKSYHRSLVRNR